MSGNLKLQGMGYNQWHDVCTDCYESQSLFLADIVGHAVVQSVEALRYKSEGRGFYSRWCHWNFSLTYPSKWLRWSRGSVLAFGTQVRGFKPGRSRWIFKGEKIFGTPSFGGEVKPSVPRRRFAACKRSLQLRGSRIVDEIVGIFLAHEEFHLTLLGGLSRRWTWRHLAEKVETSKCGGKQWQPAPKNVPRMQWASTIPVAWLGSGSC
jgi:hypothetical protein